jgi:hypothetical protein
MKPEWTEAEWSRQFEEAIRDCAQRGLSDQMIADETGVHWRTVRDKRIALGIPVCSETFPDAANARRREAAQEAVEKHCDSLIPAGRGGDAAFAAAIGPGRFDDHPRLRSARGPIPLPLPRPDSLMSQVGCAAAQCAHEGSRVFAT